MFMSKKCGQRKHASHKIVFKLRWQFSATSAHVHGQRTMVKHPKIRQKDLVRCQLRVCVCVCVVGGCRGGAKNLWRSSTAKKFDYVRGYTSFVSNSPYPAPWQIDINCFCCCLWSPHSRNLCDQLNFSNDQKVVLLFNFHKFYLNVFIFR